jgi:anti-sigma B factor antagonist
MSDTPAPASVVVEKLANATIVRLNSKMVEEKDLKLLSQFVDEAANAPGINVVVVDLSRVQMLPSLGLGTLVQISNKCRARQQRLKLAAVTPQVRQVLSITKLDRVLELSDSVEGAME